jgi:uncharacterized protein YuzE
VRFDGHYDAQADIASVRFENYDRRTVVAEEADSGLREFNPETGEIVGLEFWNASQVLAADFLLMLPPPQVEVAA